MRSPRIVETQGYELAADADSDLQEIAEYTLTKWDIEQARRYEACLEKHLRDIGAGKVRARVFLERRPELRVSRCKHHYVFHCVRKGKCVLILAIFHERMDLMMRLKARLSG